MTLPLGQTRTHVARDHALITPDGHVVAALPGWRDTPGIVLISPVMGAGFCQYLAMLGKASASAPPPQGVERVVFVRDGEVQLTLADKTHRLSSDGGGFAFIPPGLPHAIACSASATLIVFEQRYQPLPGVAAPQPVVGHAADRTASPFLGDPQAMLAPLLPADPAFDLAVNLFTFQPGAALPMVETHVFEHGLYMTKGQGIYRLADRWYPVQQGDAIWMGPYCPQWFCAIGKGPAQYLYSKNINRDAIV